MVLNIIKIPKIKIQYSSKIMMNEQKQMQGRKRSYSDSTSIPIRSSIFNQTSPSLPPSLNVALLNQ